MAEHFISQQKYNPWALVTGASSGIGGSFARLLADAGFNLLITAGRACCRGVYCCVWQRNPWIKSSIRHDLD